MKVEHLRKASVVMAKNDVRHYLCGVMVDGKNTVATDGYRGVHCADFYDYENTHEQILIPRDAVLNFLKLAKGIEEYEIKDNTLIAGDISLKFEPMGGVFPDYKRAFLSSKYEAKINEIAFIPEYLADIKKIFGKEPVIFNFEGESQVVRISQRNRECTYYLMPSRG
jgi:DNA polymerase III sliding clamp (beta) subunit (PCNA family)